VEVPLSGAKDTQDFKNYPAVPVEVLVIVMCGSTYYQCRMKERMQTGTERETK
jgi:hypothetical protein